MAANTFRSSALLFLLSTAGSALAQPCLTAYTFTASPLPVNGQYQCGQTVTFCITITGWNTTNANWIHGVVPVLGPGWDASTLTPTVTSPTQGGSNGTWGWFPVCSGTAGTAIGPVGPGFFFDLNNDGNPGNNFGDFVNGACNFQFCWSVQVPTGAACVNGLSLGMTANVYGDSETGSWGSSGCTGDINPVLNASVQACQASAGTPGGIAVCESDAPFDLFALLGGAPDAGGVWTSPLGAPLASSIVNPAQGPAGVYTYTVTEALAGCPPVSATVTVAISVNVSAGQPAGLTLCVDAPPLDMYQALNGNPSPGGAWTAPGGGASNGVFVAAAGPAGVYTYTVTPAAPCLAQSTTLTLTIDPAPWAGTDAALIRCANDGAVALFPLLGGTPNATGYWQDPSPAPHSGTLNPPTGLSGPHRYIVPGSGACTHLVDTAIVAVTINPLPRVAFSADPDSGCHPLAVNLYNDTPPEDIGANCTWQLGDGTIAAGCGTLVHTFQNPGSYGVQLTVTSPQGCTRVLNRPAVVLVEKAPEATFLISPNPGHVGNSTIFFTAQDEGNALYSWTLDGSHHSMGPRTQQGFTDALGSDHVMCLAVADRYGCADTLCQPFSIVVPAIFYPNAFTPDNDGLNDKYYPRVLDVVREQHRFQVFNRWGELIYTSTEPNDGWDGTAGGQAVPQGVYVWRLEGLPQYSADKVELFGTVTLLR